MVGYIVLFLVGCGVVYAAKTVFDKIESVVKGTASTDVVTKTAVAAGNAITAAPSKAPRYVAAAVVPAMAFLAVAVTLSIVCPPQATFEVGNVAWATRQGSVLGSTSDAILVRTTGADVHPGFLYSKATLSGVEYVSLPGTQWAAVGSEGAADIIGIAYVAVLAIVAAGLVYAGLHPRSATPAAKPALTL